MLAWLNKVYHHQRWKRTPEFLWKPTEDWPDQPADLTNRLEENEEGVKKQKIAVGGNCVKDEFWSLLFARFSSWKRFRRVIAWMIRVLRRRKMETTPDAKKDLHSVAKRIQSLSVSELNEAEEKIIRRVQEESFPKNIERMKKSSLSRLKPFRENGILRSGGRLSQSSLSYDSKHPFVMPKDNVISELIILHYHCLNGHAGGHQTLAKTRERFWITNGVAYVKRVLKKYQTCRRENARPGGQIMAPLPEVRVSSDENSLAYPFAAVGVDCFGPLYVKSGPKTRSKNLSLAKRFGCLFTCLRYRAVHIEVAQDLSTDSFINAILRFVGRRGSPRVIYGDNSTNFKGAEADVVEALKLWNQEKIQGSLSRRGSNGYLTLQLQATRAASGNASYDRLRESYDR